MSRPGTEVNISNGNLGKTNPSADGTSLLVGTGAAVTDSFAVGDLVGPFKSLADAEAAGITAAYDTTNKSLLHNNIKQFYLSENGTPGTDLYIIPLANTVTLAQMADKALTHVAPKLQELGGKVKLVAFSRVPPAGSPTYTDGLDNDIISAIDKAQALAAYEQSKKRPIRVLIEGRDIQSTYSAAKDLRAADGPDSNRVGLVVLQDKTVAGLDALFAKCAAIGYVLGKAAGNPVQRNLGRVKDGKIAITIPALSDGVEIKKLTDTNLDTLHDKGYIFAVPHMNKPGYYINDDPMCAPNSDDYAQLADGRVIDKVERITHDIYTNELLDDIVLTTEGKLPPSTAKDFEGILRDSVVAQMVGEISDINVFVDPENVVATTSEIIAEVNVYKVGYGRKFSITLGFKIDA